MIGYSGDEGDQKVTNKLVSDLALISVTRATVPATMTSQSEQSDQMITSHSAPVAPRESYPRASGEARG
jgi:hypothetical protein